MASPRLPALARWAYGGVLLLVSGLAAWILLRGSQVDERPRDPASPAEGVFCHLYREAGAQAPEIRCALRLEAAPGAVWRVITDYRHFNDIFLSRLWRLRIDQILPMDQDAYRLVGGVVAGPLEIPIRARIQHTRLPTSYQAQWDEAGPGLVQVNQGRWTVSAAGEGGSLLVYRLRVSLRGIPEVLGNGVLIGQLAPLLIQVRDYLAVQGGAVQGDAHP